MSGRSNLSDANFPTDAEGRVYHLEVKYGEVANRILSVGDVGRARRIAKTFDGGRAFVRSSGRGFVTFTGTYRGSPVSVIGTGMGTAMIDFVMRETRAVVNGPMAVLRFGTCGTPNPKIPIGSIVVASEGSVMCSRNPDAFGAGANEEPYRISKIVPSDTGLSETLTSNLELALDGMPNQVLSGLNCTACSFYSSQGRLDARFRDANETLIEETILRKHPNCSSLEMETFHLFDLARCASPPIRASAAVIVLAQRRTNAFLDNDTKHTLEQVGGMAMLETLSAATLDGDAERLANGTVDDPRVWLRPDLMQDLRVTTAKL